MWPRATSAAQWRDDDVIAVAEYAGSCYVPLGNSLRGDEEVQGGGQRVFEDSPRAAPQNGERV